jgi:hypothetical protein
MSQPFSRLSLALQKLRVNPIKRSIDSRKTLSLCTPCVRPTGPLSLLVQVNVELT